MFAEPDLKFLEDKIFITVINTNGACGPVPEVEIQIQVIKKRI